MKMSFWAFKVIFCVLFIVACEAELNTKFGDAIINQETVDSETLIYPVDIKTMPLKDAEVMKIYPSVKVLFGALQNRLYGTSTASIVTQLGLPTDMRYTTKKVKNDETIYPELDTVILRIPYEATRKTEKSTQKKYYVLDSVFGNYKTSYFDIDVYELEEVLHNIDPNGTRIKYPSNKVYSYNTATPLAQLKNFRIRVKDTVSIIKRFASNGVKYQTDTIYFNDDKVPMIAIGLKKTFFKQKILSKMPDKKGTVPYYLDKVNAFKRYFKGLYIKATPKYGSAMAFLNLSNAHIMMYYSNTSLKKSTGAINLKDDGKPKVTAQERKFPFAGVRTNKITHDHKYTNDPEKIYLQGAGGYEARLHTLGYDATNPNNVSDLIKKLRKDLNQKGKLAHVIGANLRFYVDDIAYKDQSDKDDKKLYENVPKLFMYKLAPNTKSGGAEQLEDYVQQTRYTEYQGELFKDEDGDFFYEFKITTYITNLLDKKSEDNITPLGLKVHFPTDDYNPKTGDISIEQFNLYPRGVVLSNQKSSGKKKIQLKIVYTQTNR